MSAKVSRQLVIGAVNVYIQNGLIWIADGNCTKIVGEIGNAPKGNFRTLEDLERDRRLDIVFPH